ncbi:hypothetical protein INT46_011589 [Mucor plumbeus]|uniref:Uncharacterized protein n=1 Tax=Mucor plumbeus TaxID=97098 RepID=A0A8H7R4F4_9FUNG|nr:hypothetical protein INT46_011589 [Mucor plumbeus]
MKYSFHSTTNKNNPGYVIISVALVHSEIFWFCSVLYHVFQTSLATHQPIVKGTAKRIEINRHRSQSAPPSPSNFIFKAEDYVRLDEEEQKVALRRSSLPISPIIDTNIRQRPSVYDERKGTTCPPIWWQKTRVRLGRAPVHGDAKIIVDSPKQIESPTNAPPPYTINSKETISPSIVKKYNTSLPVTTIVNNPSLLPRSGTFPLTPSSSAPNSFSSPSIYTINEENLSPSPQVSEGGMPIASEHQQKQRVKKFMLKLNTALRSIPHHRRNNSSESKISVKK